MRATVQAAVLSVATEAKAQLDPATVALLARMTTQPTSARIVLINNLIIGLKNASLWDKLDVFYMMAAHDSQAGRLNWKSGSYTLSAVSSPLFTTDRGYTTDGASSYLNTGLAPSAGAMFQQNSGSIGVYLNSINAQSDASVAMGSIGSVGTAHIIPRTTADAMRSRLNATATATALSSITNRLGFSAIIRPGSANIFGYKDGVAGALVAQASATPSEFSVFIGGANNLGSLSNSINTRFAVAFMGAALTGAELNNLRSAVLTYLTAIGANV